MSHVELARQMCLIEQDTFMLLEPCEFHNQAWLREDKVRRVCAHAGVCMCMYVCVCVCACVNVCMYVCMIVISPWLLGHWLRGMCVCVCVYVFFVCPCGSASVCGMLCVKCLSLNSTCQFHNYAWLRVGKLA